VASVQRHSAGAVGPRAQIDGFAPLGDVARCWCCYDVRGFTEAKRQLDKRLESGTFAAQSGLDIRLERREERNFRTSTVVRYGAHAPPGGESTVCHSSQERGQNMLPKLTIAGMIAVGVLSATARASGVSASTRRQRVTA